MKLIYDFDVLFIIIFYNLIINKFFLFKILKIILFIFEN